VKGDSTKLQVYVPTEVYNAIKPFGDRYGGMSRVVTLALRNYLEIPNGKAVKEASLDELAK
jgi:hypothetical protein